MKLLNTITLEIKKSKFIAYYYEINDVLETKDIITNLKKEHKKAVHFPYAYKINNIVLTLISLRKIRIKNNDE